MFEDIDQVFHDEGEFHNQLIKLIGVTKVPIILTMEDDQKIKSMLKYEMDALSINYDIVRYRYLRITQQEMKTALLMIQVFETIVTRVIQDSSFETLTLNDQMLRT